MGTTVAGLGGPDGPASQKGREPGQRCAAARPSCGRTQKPTGLRTLYEQNTVRSSISADALVRVC